MNVRLVLIFAVAVLLAVTVYYGIIFDGQLPDHRILRGKNDLFLHFCAFAALTIPWRLLWAGGASFAALAFCAAAIEAVQIFQPDRTAAFDDFAASLSGVLAGMASIALLRLAFYKVLNKNH